MTIEEIVVEQQRKIEALELLIQANLKRIAKSGAGAPAAIVPAFIGQIYIDTGTQDVYGAYGLAAGNWKKTT
jgi:hypothetical protein